MINWTGILDSLGVEYIEGPGPNVRRGHIGINCPLCHNDDKYHYSIDVETGKTRGCWRDESHWLRPVELLAAVAGIPTDSAYDMIKSDGSYVDLGSLLDLLNPVEEGVFAPQTLEWFKGAREFGSGFSAEKKYIRYLSRRDVSVMEAGDLDLRWCAHGEQGGRVYLPIHYKSDMVGWTGRAISKQAKVRYMTYPTGEMVGNTVWNDCVPEGHKASVLVASEGPFDGLAVHLAVRDLGGWATAALGLRWGPAKIDAIIRMREELDAEHLVLMLDQKTDAQALEIQSKFGIDRPEIYFLPEEYKDPGEMPKTLIQNELRQWLS